MKKEFIFLLAAVIALTGCVQPSELLTATDSIPGPEKPVMEDVSTLSEAEYVPFHKSLYDQARMEGKVIYLEFYANWCPICARQEPEILAAFEEVSNPEIVGFRVNYNDSDTDGFEKELAREFGITYQHTHVILDREGNVTVKSLEEWSKDDLLNVLESVAGEV